MSNKKTSSAKAESLELIQARQEAEFALTPAGQQLKQFEVMQRMGNLFAASSLVPKAYQGNLPNCAIACDIAVRMHANPVMVMQNLYIVNGNPAWSSKFLIATIEASGKFTPLTYEFRGKEDSDDWSCRCVAFATKDTEKKTPLASDWISIRMAKAEGWYGKTGSKWQTMPGQMLRYRAAAFWQRIYAPGISMGFLTYEEAQDIAEPDEQTQPDNASVATASDKIAQAMRGAAVDVNPETGEALFNDMPEN